MKIKNTYIGIAFLMFSAYKATEDVNVLESILYASVGIGFILMDAVKNPRLVDYKKPLNILSWIFVISGLLLFITLLRQDAYK